MVDIAPALLPALRAMRQFKRIVLQPLYIINMVLITIFDTFLSEEESFQSEEHAAPIQLLGLL